MHSRMFAIRRGLSTLASSYVTKPLISVDVSRSAYDQLIPLHNRWHPDIPSVVSVRPGDVFRVECVDWTGGQIKNDDSADDIKFVDLTRIHFLSGPIEVAGARPGDVLVVDILDVGPLPSAMWGFTGIFDHNNGGGFLSDIYREARKAIWDFQGVYAVSRHIRDVRFAGIIHPGKLTGKNRSKRPLFISMFMIEQESLHVRLRKNFYRLGINGKEN